MASITVPHIRKNLLTGEQVLVSPNRNNRPWQGKVDSIPSDIQIEYDTECYLCPGNKRYGAYVNDKYSGTYSFVNDFSALLPNDSELEHDDLLEVSVVHGVCKVLIYDPNHSLTLARMSMEQVQAIIALWITEFDDLAKDKKIKYIQIFDNKGEMMGCSNMHPHGQVWASSFTPNEIIKESKSQLAYYKKHGKPLLLDYLEREQKEQERIVFSNSSFTVLVPFWATWPYETMIIPNRNIQYTHQLTYNEQHDLAHALLLIAKKYDALFGVPFPYSSGIHQAPVNSGKYPEWQWHIHFYPPLLRSATMKKFMVGYELLANSQRDITPEQAAKMLRDL